MAVCLSVCLCAAQYFICDCSEERKSEGFKKRRNGKQLGGRGGESRDCEKSISSEYLIEFKPSDLSLLPGSKETTGAGERKSCRKEGGRMMEEENKLTTVRGLGFR